MAAALSICEPVCPTGDSPCQNIKQPKAALIHEPVCPKDASPCQNIKQLNPNLINRNERNGNGKRVLLSEHEKELGGILRQCLHRGFGLGLFGENLTGPEYAAKFIPKIKDSGIIVQTGTTVLSLSPDKTALLSGRNGLERVKFEHCILAVGCRERSFESLGIAGTRPAGIFTAGTAQQMMNLGGYRIGKRFVILGSGDIGQIMARQLTESGLEVAAMLEQRDRPGGLAKNQRDCLKACRIPLFTRTTIDEVLGSGRVRGVIARNLDSGRRWEIPCDTILTATGLVPDRALCRPFEKNGALPPWLHLCGNCESVHDIADNVTKEATALGYRLAKDLLRKKDGLARD